MSSNFNPRAAAFLPGAVDKRGAPSHQGERHFEVHEKWAIIPIEEGVFEKIPGKNHRVGQTQAYHRPDADKTDEWRKYWQYSRLGFKNRPECKPADPGGIAAEIERDRRIVAIAREAGLGKHLNRADQRHNEGVKGEEKTEPIDYDWVLTPESRSSEEQDLKENASSHTSDKSTQRRVSDGDKEIADSSIDIRAASGHLSQSV